MSEQKVDNNGNTHENTDNLSQGENMDEALANMLNTDDSRSSVELPDDGDDEEKEKLEAQVAELKDKLLRQVAEFDNYKRRVAREMNDLRQTAGKEVITSMLEVLDDMERAEKTLEANADITVAKEGISLVFNKMRNSMLQKGVRKMDAMNTEFDADLHEAITEIPAPNEDMIGKVMDVVQSGYYLNDKLIRFAKVVVGK